MRDTLVHRGPDDAGIWLEPSGVLGFGFRRLSILDLSHLGRQPMTSPSGRYTVMFNGEIFNFRQLRAELVASGGNFRGNSDTEVIVNALDRWGVHGALRRFVGMFAIAAWDAQERMLHLIRDHLGKKPLFVYRSPGIVLFGSELKALASSQRFQRRLDIGSTYAFLRYMWVPAPATIYQDTYKVRPGHVLSVRASELSQWYTEPYWSLQAAYAAGVANPFVGDEVEATAELDRMLRDAVRLRLESDVPLGSLLSGGIDSSTVTAVMQDMTSSPVRTYSIGFAGTEHDESEDARKVADFLGTQHTPMQVTEDEALAVVPLLASMFDEPHADPSQVPTYLVAKLARREVTVALTGDGGDELFGGYHRYISGRYAIDMAVRVPSFVRRLLGSMSGAVPPAALVQVLNASGHSPRLATEKLIKLRSLIGRRDEAEMYCGLLSPGWDPLRKALANRDATQDEPRHLLLVLRDLPLLHRMMCVDQLTYLPDDLLAKVDRASMAVSLEARVPILDHRVVEFAWRLPDSYKIRNGRGKYLLRRVLDRYVPRDLVDRPKVGFSVPLDDWLRGRLRPWADALLQDVREPFDGRVVRSLWARFQSGEDGLGLSLWTVAMFQAWRLRWRVD